MTRAAFFSASRTCVWVTIFSFFGSLPLPESIYAAGPEVEIVLGDQAPDLERFAANQLAEQLNALFDGKGKDQIRVVTQPTFGVPTILLGSPETNPAVRVAVGDTWPKMSSQGHLLRTVKVQNHTALVVGGSTPQATLWGATELAHQFGLRSLLQADFTPVEIRPFKLDGFDLLLEPNVQVRAWRTLDGGPLGWESWGLEDHRRLLGQLAKLKFNEVQFAFGPTQPFLDFESGGIKKSTGALFSGRQFSVAGDTAGRKAFGGARLFENPEFAGLKSYEERSSAGTTLVRNIMDAAHRLGLRVAVQLDPLELPPEMTKAVGRDDQQVIEASVDQLRACLETYPQMDALELVLPDRKGLGPAIEAWKKVIASNVGARRSPGRPLVVHFRERDRQSLVNMELFKESVGVLPQQILSSLPKLVHTANQRGWCVAAKVPSDAELGVYYLSRGAFDEQLTPEKSSEELITTIAGTGIAERLMKGFAMVEQAGQIIEKESQGFASPAPGMVLQHASGTEVPPWWTQVQTLYTDAMNEMYRGNTRAREGGRNFILYYARRYEFGLTYMASLQAFRLASIAKSKGDSDLQQQHLESSVEGMYNALGAFSEVARDPSDRGVIALLNEFAYRPLSAKLQE